MHKGKCVQTITVQAVLCQTLLPIMSREAAVDPASGSSALEKWKMIEPGKGDDRFGCGQLQPAGRHSPQSSAKALSRSAALSGVISRCGIPNISNPTMNFRMVADRNKGGKKWA